ncbi:Restriction endonuclease [Halanaerobium congolense]|jgi:hypothetical protein|uniref:Restriction endonuclease n=1 Tax=Halanaerobium congolense TaxID=54121 RepID=A0A1H9ZPL8_9FIRM|nr:restriction endonuclease [Halanaerobium congolense]SDF09002.1 Restriction endonuclease [Halanaerobium congolense]SES82771.1 Restriction endonuclease [Halanaerobium congolense]SFO95982.1 Restriction endonuclease [Halanaerobium congolense]
MKPTRTTGRLHFDDLSPQRFEDLSLAMIYRINHWTEIYHYGKTGADDGIDIYAEDELNNGKKRVWNIQCKRHKKFKKNQLEKVIDKIIAKNEKIPDILLLIVACDISKKNIEHFKDYAIENGINNARIWTSSVIESKLYAEHHDLLFSFFGVNLNFKKRNKIASIRRNINLKQKMKKDFLKKSIKPQETLYQPYKKFNYSEVLIRSIDDTSYPEVEKDNLGISSWFKVEIYNFYYNGLEVILNLKKCIIDENWNWDVVEYDDTERKKKI